MRHGRKVSIPAAVPLEELFFECLKLLNGAWDELTGAEEYSALVSLFKGELNFFTTTIAHAFAHQSHFSIWHECLATLQGIRIRFPRTNMKT